VKFTLIEKMEKRVDFPKTWIAETKRLIGTIKEKDELLQEYGEIIDVLARRVEQLEEMQAS